MVQSEARLAPFLSGRDEYSPICAGGCKRYAILLRLLS